MSLNLKECLEKYYYSMSMEELRSVNLVDPESKMSYNDTLYLDVIKYTEKCTVSKLADMLHVTKPTITSKVNELYAKGYLIKTRSEDDGRVVFLSLSNKSDPAYAEEDRMNDVLIDALVREYDDDDLKKFCEMLNRSSEVLKEHQSAEQRN